MVMWSMSIKSKILLIVLMGMAALSLKAQSNQQQKPDLGALMEIATTEHPMVRARRADVEVANAERKVLHGNIGPHRVSIFNAQIKF